MTPEEAKLLRPGDYVLAIVKIEQNYQSCIRIVSEYIDHGYITEKLSPTPFRKFREGDIVRYGDELHFVISNEDCLSAVIISSEEHAEYGHMVDAAELTLICAAENREDRKEEA